MGTSGFVHYQISPDVWLGVCESCREVVAIAATEPGLSEAEDGHTCRADQSDSDDPAA